MGISLGHPCWALGSTAGSETWSALLEGMGPRLHGAPHLKCAAITIDVEGQNGPRNLCRAPGNWGSAPPLPSLQVPLRAQPQATLLLHELWRRGSTEEAPHYNKISG